MVVTGILTHMLQCSMQVNAGMQVMNGQPQQGYAPQPQFASAPRPATPTFQQFSHPPSSAGLPPPPGSVATMSMHPAVCSCSSLCEIMCIAAEDLVILFFGDTCIS